MTEDDRKQIGDNLRFHSDVRFKQLTLFLAWITLLAGGLFQFEGRDLAKSVNASQAIPVLAMLVTAVFWIMEIRASLNWRANRDRAKDLWPSLPPTIWSWLNATNALFVLYAAMYAAWLQVALMQGTNRLVIWLAAIPGIVVLVAGVHLYVLFSKPGSTLAKSDG